MAGECISTHRVFVYDRGGKTRLAEITRIARVIWGRERDDISEAEIKIDAMYCDEISHVLNGIQAGRHELVIYRNGKRRWEGPINRIAYEADGITIVAKDVMYYAYRLALSRAYDNGGSKSTFVTTRAATILRTELGRRETETPPINVVPFITEHHKSTDARTAAKTVIYEKTVFEEVDDAAAKRGIDYTVLGRAIHLWDTHEPAMGQTPDVTESDFLSTFTLTYYGAELGTRAIVTNGQGQYGVADSDKSYYGLWERLDDVYDEDAGGASPTTAEMKSQAKRNLNARNPTPMQLRVPDNSSIDPRGVLNVDNLVPGVWIPMRATMLSKKINQVQKLSSMKVTEDAKGEKISVVMYPASGLEATEVP